jgi:hypothetical protein
MPPFEEAADSKKLGHTTTSAPTRGEKCKHRSVCPVSCERVLFRSGQYYIYKQKEIESIGQTAGTLKESQQSKELESKKRKKNVLVGRASPPKAVSRAKWHLCANSLHNYAR